MKKISNRQGNPPLVAATVPGFSQLRRRLLQLGMVLGGFALARHLLHLPPRASGQAFVDNGLSRHEAAFYSIHDSDG
jgi:hypothetical protein